MERTQQKREKELFDFNLFLNSWLLKFRENKITHKLVLSYNILVNFDCCIFALSMLLRQKQLFQFCQELE